MNTTRSISPRCPDCHRPIGFTASIIEFGFCFVGTDRFPQAREWCLSAQLAASERARRDAEKTRDALGQSMLQADRERDAVYAQIADAHIALDALGIARGDGARPRTLAERIAACARQYQDRIEYLEQHLDRLRMEIPLHGDEP